MYIRTKFGYTTLGESATLMSKFKLSEKMKDKLIEEFKIFATGNQGIENFISEKTDKKIIDRLLKLKEENEPLSNVQLNQLLVLSQEPAVSDGFFDYYWYSCPDKHPYNVTKLPFYASSYEGLDLIKSIEHLKWGLMRIYYDGLLFFGDVKHGYRELCLRDKKELESFFEAQRMDTEGITTRGHSLPFNKISKDNRYLISEMACKSYGEMPTDKSELKSLLIDNWKEHKRKGGGGKIKIRDLLLKNSTSNWEQLSLSADEILDDTVSNIKEIEEKYSTVAKKYLQVRKAALENTELYLSIVKDLDVYVATSMRTRADFRNMADFCESVFHDREVHKMNLKYFDPTMSAAEGHLDKGIIECLMVKCSKVLLYCAGATDTSGKDAEAAMALSLGKPVIFYCDENARKDFYKEVHPLSRLVNFNNGVVVGAIVTDKIEEVSKLLVKIFSNDLEFILEHPKPGYLQLKEKITGSVVRMQTNNRLLTHTFWNYYHHSLNQIL